MHDISDSSRRPIVSVAHVAYASAWRSTIEAKRASLDVVVLAGHEYEIPLGIVQAYEVLAEILPFGQMKSLDHGTQIG